MKTVARVVTNLSLDREFDYRIPRRLCGQVRVGSRVRVPFGRGNSVRDGYVVKLVAESSYPDLKEILGLQGEQEQIPAHLVDLARWIADYYCCAREQAVRATLPAVVRGGKVRRKKENVVELAGEADLNEALPRLERRAPKQAAVLHALLRRHSCSTAVLRSDTGADMATVRRLEKRGLVRVRERTVDRDPFAADVILPTEHLTLTPAQAGVLQMIGAGLDKGEADTVLLHGVTGSGKTEVYLQAIDHCLSLQRGAIVLVPEISLTPQTTERFRSRFGDQVSVLHSGLGEGERFDEWTKVHTGRTRIVVGARSALFAPVRNLGLIVVDEEHETTYKQDEAPRYNARDVAVVRGHMEKAVVVLGSATPSLESYYNCHAGKYRLAELKKRVDGQKMPHMELVDMRAEAMLRGGAQIFSRRLQDLIRGRLEDGSQTILFLNRRGYATQMMCTACGFVATCEACNLAYTYHRRDQRLLCHLCGNLLPAYAACPQCGDKQIRYSGLGTEKVESAARALFPHATIARMDSDTMTRKDSYRKTLNAFRAGRIHILIGTQMIAKGLHFPNVTLVGVIFADLGLHRPDFRAGERTFQLLTQVAGRAGRGEISGHVVVQSYTPFHSALQHALDHDFHGFYEEEIEMRQVLEFPPVNHMAIVNVRGADEGAVSRAADDLGTELTDRLPQSVHVSGPMPAPMAKVRGKFRFQMTFRTRHIVGLGRLLRRVILPRNVPGIDISIDIDPVSLM